MPEPLLDKRFHWDLRCRIIGVSEPHFWICPVRNLFNEPTVLRDHSFDDVVLLVGPNPDSSRGLMGGVQVVVVHTALRVMVDISVRLTAFLIIRTALLSIGRIDVGVEWLVALEPSPDPSKTTRKCLDWRPQEGCSMLVVLFYVTCRSPNGTFDADKILDGSEQVELHTIEVLVYFRSVSMAVSTVSVDPEVHMELSI
jgi:hypothetical protein